MEASSAVVNNFFLLILRGGVNSLAAICNILDGTLSDLFIPVYLICLFLNHVLIWLFILSVVLLVGLFVCELECCVVLSNRA